MFFVLLILSYQSVTTQLFIELNKFRESIGKMPFRRNENLMKVAYDQSEHMRNVEICSHSGPNNTSLKQRVMAANYKYCKIAENVAQTNCFDVKEVLELWKKSPGHFKNMCGDYLDAGVGCAQKNGKVYWTNVFGTLMTDATN